MRNVVAYDVDEQFSRTVFSSLFLPSYLSRGFVFPLLDINQLSLPTPFYSVLVSISVFMALSTVFHFIHSPDNSSPSHSVLPVLFLALLDLSTIYLFLNVSVSPDIILCG